MVRKSRFSNANAQIIGILAENRAYLRQEACLFRVFSCPSAVAAGHGEAVLQLGNEFVALADGSQGTLAAADEVGVGGGGVAPCLEIEADEGVVVHHLLHQGACPLRVEACNLFGAVENGLSQIRDGLFEFCESGGQAGLLQQRHPVAVDVCDEDVQHAVTLGQRLAQQACAERFQQLFVQAPELFFAHAVGVESETHQLVPKQSELPVDDRGGLAHYGCGVELAVGGHQMFHLADAVFVMFDDRHELAFGVDACVVQYLSDVAVEALTLRLGKALVVDVVYSYHIVMDWSVLSVPKFGNGLCHVVLSVLEFGNGVCHMV